MPGILYLVATPIGNLGDITYRAVETLKKADLIACEDTRHSRTLLSHYGIEKPLVSYFDASEKRKAPFLIEKIKEGASVALISDAGTPGIADPGYRLITEALKQGVRIEALPGPSAVITALVLSGFPMDRFIFEGFLPVKLGAKKRFFESIRNEERTVIFYESPHRILKTLEAAREILGNAPVAICRELTKKFEEVVRGSLEEAAAYFQGKKILGEFVVLLSLKNQKIQE